VEGSRLSRKGKEKGELRRGEVDIVRLYGEPITMRVDRPRTARQVFYRQPHFPVYLYLGGRFYRMYEKRIQGEQHR
jgi:hypothetical protein